MPHAHLAPAAAMALCEKVSAHNYHSLPVVVAKGSGAWVTDIAGKRYLDMLAAYSALNFGHCHPRLVEVAQVQLQRVTLTSRAFYNSELGPMCEALCELCGLDMVLPMNTGAEAVETAIKMARKWGYKVKGVADGQAKIIVCQDNFHGRTTTIVSFSTDPQAKADFGPLTQGFVVVPYGDIEALAQAITEETVAFLVEPIQGEAGVVVPPAGYLQQAHALCRARNVLFLADEIQSGLGRTGATFVCEQEGVLPDAYILGKALGGGIVPVSAVVARREVMEVFAPGDHGSTFGGNPLACAVAREVVAMLKEGHMQARARELGTYLMQALQGAAMGPLQTRIKEVRGRGLWVGLELRPEAGPARPYCERLLDAGMLCKDTHGQTIRLAPPLVIKWDEVDWALERLYAVLTPT